MAWNGIRVDFFGTLSVLDVGNMTHSYLMGSIFQKRTHNILKLLNLSAKVVDRTKFWLKSYFHGKYRTSRNLNFNFNANVDRITFYPFIIGSHFAAYHSAIQIASKFLSCSDCFFCWLRTNHPITLKMLPRFVYERWWMRLKKTCT